MKKNILLLLVASATFLFSCRKHIGPEYYFSPVMPGSANKDSFVVTMNREIAVILEKVYQNDSAYREVTAAIFSQYYEDERVLLRDLLFPESSGLYATDEFNRRRSGRGIFKREFNKELTRGGHPVLEKALEREERDVQVPAALMLADQLQIATGSTGLLSGPQAVAIYFPYSTNFDNGNIFGAMPATIVAADREANTAPGRMPGICSAGMNSYCYTDVIVDDQYADSMPTHIVENGARPKLPLPAENTGVPAPEVSRIYLGWTKLTRQMDALVSFTGNGGGSEIKVARLSGYLKKELEQVVSFSGDVVTLQFSRSEIRHQDWKRIYSVWDPNWTDDNPEQVFAVYEDDTKGMKTLSGSLSTTINFPGKPSAGKAVGEIAYKVEVSTQDDIITQRKLERSSYFSQGMGNQGWGFVGSDRSGQPFLGSWPVYDGGTIWMYSMPWRIN